MSKKKGFAPQGRRQKLFAAIALGVGLGVGLVLVELGLRQWASYLEKSDDLAPGLVSYDQRLGWRLRPNWSGSHRHFDFSVQYKTNAHGFRGDFDGAMAASNRGRCVVLGDSFTFGLGVADEETFCALLGGMVDGWGFFNFGVLGYSTDQELLLTEEVVLRYRPDIVVLVVYLANDLFDNSRAFPLQANRGKPYFVLGDAGLELKNVPVPLGVLPAKTGRETLNQVVMQGRQAPSKWLRRIGQFELGRRLLALSTREERASFTGLYDDDLALFVALVDRLEGHCQAKGAELKVVLLPGRSAIEQPQSLGGRFQSELGRKILRHARQRDWEVLALGPLLKGEGGPFYYHNEGHLNAAGHQRVAQALAAAWFNGGED